MITQRFRPLAWVAGVGIAATALYTVSLQVANERARLQGLEDKITATKNDIRQLQTELGTRGSLRQLERWNGEVLSLVAPGANQFLPNETALAKVDGAIAVPGKYVPAPVMVAADVANRESDPAEGGKTDDGADVDGASTTPTKAQRVAVLEETLTGKADQIADRQKAGEKQRLAKEPSKP
jgi:hypothetical protein